MKYGQLVETGLRLAKSTNKVVIKKIKQILFRLSVLRWTRRGLLAREPFFRYDLHVSMASRIKRD